MSSRDNSRSNSHHLGDPPRPPTPANNQQMAAPAGEVPASISEDRNAAAIISAVSAQIRDEDRLLPDGSKYATWKDFMEERCRDAVNNPEYLCFCSFNDVQERIICSIFISSVNRSMHWILGRFNTVHEMYLDVTARFTTVSRAAQLNHFRRLLRFDIRDHPTSATIGPSFDDHFDALEQMNILLTRDQLAGLILQNSLGAEPETMVEVYRRVELAISSSRHNRIPDFDAIVRMIDIARCNIAYCNEVRGEDQQMAINPTLRPPAVHLATTQDGQAPPDGPHPDNIPDAADFAAMQAGVCWQCRSPEHLLRNCPLCQRNNLARQNFRLSSRQAPPPGVMQQPEAGYAPGFQGFYPIVAPAGYTGTYPQVQPPARHSPTAPAASPRGADSYRPQYRLQRVDTRRPGNTSIGNPASQPAACSSDLPAQDEPQARIVEIGYLEDELAQLNFSHADVEMIDTAPIVDSATKGEQAYVTGQGDLHFNGLANQGVTLQGVLYCKSARNTLISLAAFREANAKFNYDMQLDRFNVFTNDGCHVFSCSFIKNKNKWIFPFPLCNPTTTKIPTHLTTLPTPLSFCPITTVERLKISTNFYVPLDLPSEEFNRFDQDLTKDEQCLLYWHRLFGHASLRKIKHMCLHGLGLALPGKLPSGEIKCATCAISKSLLKNQLDTDDRMTTRLGVITADLIGPLQVPTFNEGQYVFTIRDIGTGFCEVKIINSKAETCNLVIETIERWEKLTGDQVKIVRSDNGGEFSSNVFLSYLTERLIKAERALPYHHYQNGAIERFNRTLSEMGRTILIDSGLNKSFWGFSFIWAGDTLNRIPNKSSGLVTPFEAFHGFKPSFDRQRLFGETGFVHIHAENRKKLDVRAVEGQVVANLDDSKGWLMWVKEDNSLRSLAIIQWREKKPSLLIPPQLSIPERKPTVSPPGDSALSSPPSKHSVKFLMNQLNLGDFSGDILMEEQELIVDKVLQECSFYAATVPRTYLQAQKSKDWTKWSAAIEEELANLKTMGVWTAMPCPTGKRPLDGRWVFAEKMNDQSETIRWKARYVAKGFTQTQGVDFDKTFAPTATFVSMRLLLSLAANFNWPVRSFDFVAAYLNSPIDEEVWVRAPAGLKLPDGYAMKLHKALYGTRQAVRCWWLHLKGILEQLGYVASQYDNSLYTLKHPREIGIVWIHVDNGIVTGSSDELLRRLKTGLKGVLQIKWSDGLESIVGLEIKRNQAGFQLRQPKLIDQILRDHWDGVFTAPNPLPTNLELISDPNGNTADLTDYLSVIGALSYIAVGTQPEIAYAVNILARFSAKPGINHWKGVQHLINYLANSRLLHLNLYPRQQEKALKCFCDASWGGKLARSTYGILITFFGCPVLWASRRFATVAASTCQAEYMALGIGTRQVLWVRHLLQDILKRKYTGHLHCDNQAAVHVSTDDSANKRVRHVDREYFLTNQSLHRKETSLVWVPTTDQLADVLTKALGREPFERFKTAIMSGV
ncbi:hypothetical protein PCANC_20397 [Puccinia coronata f. sp. avenae]|uniref:Integrase catalytic domain-containing protein n=1 Tax=Puccinia coronata f. sp. avenae TaxID=200324 RepID=A0A2N5UEQ8_9BASI|nr:hypothetical protein PCANC_20397 [Puccinia coronata f. sp. avenae]PLW38950.1 hypothetical protein PCASD_11731 [Puccinia coronata f. sp. avenae]